MALIGLNSHNLHECDLPHKPFVGARVYVIAEGFKTDRNRKLFILRGTVT